MTDGVHHAAQLRRVVALDGLADAPQPQGAQRVALAPVGAVGRLDLGDDEAHVTASAITSGSSSDSSAVGSSGLPPRPSTVSTDRPRSAATSSGLRRSCRPAMVALTRLIGFCEPSDFDRMSWIPASSSTARTPPPAITPVPGEAGFRKTRPDPKMPVVWWVIVEPWRGTRNRFFFARSTPFWIASGTSLALP